MVQSITAAELKHLLDTQATCALIDIREAGEYNATHIPGASLVPRRQLEFRMRRLVPYHGTLVIVCDDDCQRAPLAAATLEQMGYTRVRLLADGLKRWTTEGYRTEWGVNVPSKEFGEKMEVQHHVPVMHPEELHRRLQGGEKLIILDSRTPEEHHRVTIPQACSAPNGELALRISGFVQDPEATVVVHCAGRTRSIIGARLLQRMGMRNVYDLRNGTMGWSMAGLELEYGSSRLALPAPTPEGLRAAEAFATRLATEDGVRYLTIDALQALTARAAQENVYLIDVRTEAEYAKGHIPGFQWFPGGQAVQRADDLVAVRNGHVVFACDGRVRATVAASWYRQIGFPNVYAVDGGVTAWSASGLSLAQSATHAASGGYDEGLVSDDLPFGYEAATAKVDMVTPQALQRLLNSAAPPVVIFVDLSADFSRAHVPGTHWIPRGWLEARVAGVVPSMSHPVAVTCSDGLNAVLAGGTLKDSGYQQVAVLQGGMAAWQRAALPVEQGLSGIMSMPHDVLPMGIDRNWADAMHYLRWEEALGEKYATS